MGIYADALVAASERLRKEFKYKIRDIEIHGKIEVPLITSIFLFVEKSHFTSLE